MHGFHLFQLRSIGLLNFRFSVGSRLVGVGLGSHTPNMFRENEGVSPEKRDPKVHKKGPQKRNGEVVCFATFVPIFRRGKITFGFSGGKNVLL